MNNNCKICSRKLDGTRSVSYSTILKHTNCPIYEVVEQVIPQKFAQHPHFTDKNSKKLLFINENVIDKTENSEYNKEWQDLVKVSKLCFRCYRVLLGIDYHGFELKRLKGQLIKLSEDSKEENEMDAKKDGLPIQSVIDSGNNIETKIDLTNMQVIESIDPTDIELIVDENMSINKEWTNNEDNVKIHPILDLANPVFKAGEIDADNDNTKRNRRCTRLLDYEYLEINEKYIKKKSLNEKSENNYKEIKIEKYTKTKKKGPILCRNCHKKFKTKKSLNTHKCHQGRSSIKNNAYSCKVCGINMNSKQSYIEHVESCYKNIVVQCDYCPVKLPSAAFLPRHMEAYHEGQPVISKEVLCDQCGREFARKESLDRHQATVHGVSYGQHQCSQCGRTFLHTSLLAEHMRAHRGYNCDQCAKSFSCNSNLRLHLRTQHQNKHLYHCLQCNKHWKFHTSYIYHLRKVHGVNRHRCSRCCQHFSSEAEFVLHKNNCHKIDSKVKNKQSKSRLSAHNDKSEKFVKSENLLIKTDKTDSKKINLHENSPVFKRNEKELEKDSEQLPLKQHRTTDYTFVPQEILLIRNHDVYGNTDPSSYKTKSIVKESDNENDLITNSQQLMLKDKVGIWETAIINNELVDKGFEFNNRKEQIAYISEHHEYGNQHEKMSSLKSEVSALRYVHGNIIEINSAPPDEYDVKLLTSESDIVVETCEEYPPECQYVIIVEDQEHA